jgi:uncharacterized membrane protein YfcA
VGSAGGITSLISYPALLAVGVPPLAANATNIVALAAFWPGAALGSGPELAGWGRWLWRWTPVTLVGGALGAVLLLVTPSEAFKSVVPFLVLAGAVALVSEPWLSRRREVPAHRITTLTFWLVGLAVYSGYFGAGSGVMTLALILIAVERHLPTANALKNMLIGAATVPASILLAIFASVHWADAAALAPGILVGSRLGPAVARHVPATALRWGVFALGIALAVQLWINPTF